MEGEDGEVDINRETDKQIEKSMEISTQTKETVMMFEINPPQKSSFSITQSCLDLSDCGREGKGKERRGGREGRKEEGRRQGMDRKKRERKEEKGKKEREQEKKGRGEKEEKGKAGREEGT